MLKSFHSKLPRCHTITKSSQAKDKARSCRCSATARGGTDTAVEQPSNRSSARMGCYLTAMESTMTLSVFLLSKCRLETNEARLALLMMPQCLESADYPNCRAGGGARETTATKGQPSGVSSTTSALERATSRMPSACKPRSPVSASFA